MRFLPDQPLPPYTHVPGRTPHPESDPLGHSYGQPRPVVAVPDPVEWRSCVVYLRGVDLINEGFFWEAHVEFEALWVACGRRSPMADFFKGLVKLSAAGVKHLQGSPESVRSHAARAAELWSAVQREVRVDRYFGLSPNTLIETASSIAQNGWREHVPRLCPTSEA